MNRGRHWRPRGRGGARAVYGLQGLGDKATVCWGMASLLGRGLEGGGWHAARGVGASGGGGRAVGQAGAPGLSASFLPPSDLWKGPVSRGTGKRP